MPQGKDLDHVVVGHIVDINPHPNADKLRLVVTDIGKKKVTIVCGGSNIKKGQWVAVALVGAHVRWHGAGDLVELKPVEIRGVKSDGMICGANEIGLADAFPHAEKEILDLGLELGFDVGAGLSRPARGNNRGGRENPAPTKPGMPLVDLLGSSDDVVMDIEVTSNRVDAMGMVGMAREAAAILNRKFIWKPAKLVGGAWRAPSDGIRACGTRPYGEDFRKEALSALHGSENRRRYSRTFAVVDEA